MSDIVSWLPKPIQDLVRPEACTLEPEFLDGRTLQMSKTAVRIAAVVRLALAGVAFYFMLTLPIFEATGWGAIAAGVGTAFGMLFFSVPTSALAAGAVGILIGVEAIIAAMVFRSFPYLVRATAYFACSHFLIKHYRIPFDWTGILERRVIVPLAISLANRWDPVPARA